MDCVLGRSVAGLSIDDLAEPTKEVLDGFGAVKLVLLELGVVLKLQACEAAFEASGRDLCVCEGRDGVGLLSFPGRKVRNILPPFFSGDGVRDFSSPGMPGDNEEPLRVWVRFRLFSLTEPLPEVLRGAMAGRYGKGGGLERSA